MNKGSTHWETCWRDPDHHECAMQRIAELEEVVRSFQAGYSTIAEALGTEVAGTNDWDLRDRVLAVIAERDQYLDWLGQLAAYVGSEDTPEDQFDVDALGRAISSMKDAFIVKGQADDALMVERNELEAQRDAALAEAERLRRLIAGEGDIPTMKEMLRCRARLTERQRRVLTLRYGLDGVPLSRAETAKECGVTKNRVRYIEEGALRRIRQLCAVVEPAPGGEEKHDD